MCVLSEAKRRRMSSCIPAMCGRRCKPDLDSQDQAILVRQCHKVFDWGGRRGAPNIGELRNQGSLKVWCYKRAATMGLAVAKYKQ